MMPVGGVDTLKNAQCRISGTGSSATPGGNYLTLTPPVFFKPPFVGPQNTYLFTIENSGAVTNWQQMGTWTAYPTPAPGRRPAPAP